MSTSSSLFTERSNGRYNNRTFPKTAFWRGTGFQAIATADARVFEFRVWDHTRPMFRNRLITMWSPDGRTKINCIVDTFDYSRNTSAKEDGKSINCGVMVVRDISMTEVGPARKKRAPTL